MLTGLQIKKEFKKGGIIIKPFDESQLNPNSYNVCLGDELLTYRMPMAQWLDPHEDNPTTPERIGSWGMVIQPGKLYLGVTKEYTESWTAIPMINGRSSLARLGLVVHQTGGFGDLGFCGRWTLELTCVHPLKLYAGMRIAQICWFYPVGRRTLYRGKYAHSKDKKPVSSRFHLEKDDAELERVDRSDEVCR